MRDTPKKEQDCQSAKQGRHRIHHFCHSGRIGCKLREQVGRQHKERCSGRMPYFQLVSRRNELTAIPETGSGFDSHQIDGRSDRKNDPAQHVVDQFILSHTLYKV